MLQNKIYQNFIKEILKTFLVILFGLSVIAWTVRAVSFLDLIVENGYSIITYFQYSFLNLFGIMTKFIPLSFLLSLMIFIIKQLQENEFIILWTSGVKKLRIINLFFIVSIFIFIFYICFSAFITPFALNKSRLLLSKDGFNSFLPTIRIQQFSDSFEGFTFIVDKKFKNQIKNVFIHDESNTLKNIASDSSDNNSTTIIAQEGIVEEKRMLLFDGKIIFSKKEKFENNIVKFSQLNIDLKDLKTSTIKNPKLQETFTLDLIRCIFGSGKIDILNCKEHTKNEIITNLNRRLVLPLYIPVIALMCSFLLIKTRTKNNYFLNKNTIFIFSFLILLYAELIIRYTGVSRLIGSLFLVSPILLMPIIYVTLMFKLSNESLKK